MAQAQVERTWLTPQTHTPDAVVVSWQTATPTESVIRYKAGEGATQEEARLPGTRTLHHVEIPVKKPDTAYSYTVGTGSQVSQEARFQSLPAQGELRVAIVGDWGYTPGRDLSALKNDKVHLLLTAGDNVPSLHEAAAPGLKAFGALIDQQPDLFRSTPFLPILGNHDREVRPRGPKPPAEPVYDVEATAYREFFALPGEEWRWHFDIPAFDVRFVALDLNHISDFGTTWQTCHAWDESSDQFQWYKKLMAETISGYVFTLNNERQSSLAGKTKGLWHEQFRKGSALVTGFGYFAERAELEGGLPYFNTCLKGDGSPYKDARSAFFASQDNYLLLTFTAGSDKMKVQIKNLKGEVLDTREITKRGMAK
ncbi:metallophosphoesterase [Verrucomicrobium sp. BvORR034]|uniref:fibronectin type III domain-containing protein n=1 Tax=Verrucomicrobium sp. BvORR034 TaxID=1396418 RepID=UPI0007C785BE|nr:metallophosphoesterase [Verrucomicrobium sp. BvORR034]